MNKLKSIILLLLPVFAVMIACDSQANSNGIKGTVTGASNLQVTLERANFDRTNISLGRATCDGDGVFNIKLEKPWEEGLYRLKIGAKQVYFITNGKETLIEITGDLNTIDKMDVQVKGSESILCYAGIIKDLVNKKLETPDEAKAYIQRGCSPLMQTFFTIQLLGQNAGPFIEDFKAQSVALKAAMPGSKYSTDFDNLIAKLETQKTQSEGGGEGITVGMAAPEISLPDPGGKVRTLSSLKGKVVLLDFWASWCGPCRKANPHVVEIYNKYKGKGFDVFSVSLDREDGKQKWIDAIKQDGLVWSNHVSDLKFWDSAPAGVYGVRSIPKTFLIGKDGKIVAVNPRDLEAELLKVL